LFQPGIRTWVFLEVAEKHKERDMSQMMEGGIVTQDNSGTVIQHTSKDKQGEEGDKLCSRCRLDANLQKFTTTYNENIQLQSRGWPTKHH